jgi:pyruvate dehydrogenase E2 component (dihydrolipoamide acetyltransferase)
MTQIVEVKVPDIGDFKDVPIIEVLVKVGDTVKAEDSLITLESDKATMDVPSPVSGVVREIKLKVGEGVRGQPGRAGGQRRAQARRRHRPRSCARSKPCRQRRHPQVALRRSTVEVRVPDIGDFKDVPIIELLVKVGDTVKAEDSLMTLESDKATMDIPSPVSGVVSELKVQVGDKVAEGVLLALVSVSAQGVGATAVTRRLRRLRRPPWQHRRRPPQPAAPAPVAAPVATPVDYRPGAAERLPRRRAWPCRRRPTACPARPPTPAPRCAASPANSASM